MAHAKDPVLMVCIACTSIKLSGFDEHDVAKNMAVSTCTLSDRLALLANSCTALDVVCKLLTLTYKKKTKTSAKMATPSLSYDPATDLEMYDGTLAANRAANSPAP